MTNQKVSAQQMIQFLMMEAAQRDEEIRMLKLQIYALQNPVEEEGEINDDTIQAD